MICVKCNTEAEEDGSKFCFNCGAQLKMTDQPRQPEVAVMQHHEMTNQLPPESNIPTAPSSPEKPIRGRVLVYDQATGNGVISSDGNRFEFDVKSWSSDNPPHVGGVVNITQDGDTRTFTPVEELLIKKEKLTEFAVGWSKEIRVNVLVAYGVFVVSMLFLPFANIFFFKPSLYDLMGSGLRILAWVAVVSIALPICWADRRSYGAYLLPSAVLGLAFMQSPLSDMHFEIGFWALSASAGWLFYQACVMANNDQAALKNEVEANDNA